MTQDPTEPGAKPPELGSSEESSIHRSPTWLSWLGWLLILPLVSFVAYRQAARPTNQAAAEAHAGNLFVLQLQAKYLIGVKELLGPAAGALRNQVAALEKHATGPRERLALVPLAAEIENTAAAQARLQTWNANDQAQATAELQAASLVLERIFSGSVPRAAEPEPAAPVAELMDLTAEERDLLTAELGWLGRLALSRADQELVPFVHQEAQRVAVLLLGLTFIGLGGMAAGFALGIGMLVRLWVGQWSPQVAPAMPHSGVYALTFALWLGLFLLLSYVGSLVGRTLVIATASMFLSLGALALPLSCGISWSQVRQDIGWHRGRGVLREAFCGVLTYLMALPLMAGALLVTLVLIARFHLRLPVHPIAPEAAAADGWQRLTIFLLASLAAPIVEETMFRGVFYRHLRDGTRRWSRIASIACAMLLSSFVFAVIHPQGILGVPALMAIAVALCWGREWRGSLLAPMVAHGLNNGLMLALVSLIGR